MITARYELIDRATSRQKQPGDRQRLSLRREVVANAEDHSKRAAAAKIGKELSSFVQIPESMMNLTN